MKNINKKDELIEEEPNENNNFKKIPLNLFQTWHIKYLPKHMNETVLSLKNNNPEFTHHLYDDTDCRSFISEHFNSDVLQAFDKLIPGAYKADLWRLCVLYIYGGIYLDIKFKCINGFKFINLIDKEYYVKDRPFIIDKSDLNNNIIPIYNGLMISYRKNSKLLDAINKIVDNTKNKYYGPNEFYPTGPMMLGLLFKKYNFEFSLAYIGFNITLNDTIILEEYAEYRSEQHLNQSTPYYSLLWKKHKIYK